MEVNRAKFYSIVYAVTMESHDRSGIGTYKEKKLHIILKKYFEENAAYPEIPANGFIADILHGGVITEIETAGFSGLKPKLAAYLPDYRVNLVHPLIGKKTVSWIDPETGSISAAKRSPKKEGAYDLLFEAVRILPYVNHPNLTLLGPVLEADEYRMLDGWSRDKKRGSHRFERVPSDLLDMIELGCDDDYRRLIPDGCGESFGTADFAARAGIGQETARAVLKVMEARGVVRFLGKEGRRHLWGRV